MTFPTVYNPKRRGSRPKYGNKKVTVQGIKFDSKWESERYLYIKSLERAGRVRNLELQVRFALEVNGQKICTYIADFRYEKKMPTVIGKQLSKTLRVLKRLSLN